MQQGYRYALVAPAGGDFHPDFRPDLTPAEMLALGVFGGKYMTDCRDEFPASWFAAATLSPERRDPSLNWFGVDASQPLSVWRAKGWIHPDDPRGWFQWYCRYYQGRRMAGEDERQIGRWKAIRRHRRPTAPRLRARRSLVPAAPAPGAAALGVRQPLVVISTGAPGGIVCQDGRRTSSLPGERRPGFKVAAGRVASTTLARDIGRCPGPEERLPGLGRRHRPDRGARPAEPRRRSGPSSEQIARPRRSERDVENVERVIGRGRHR